MKISNRLMALYNAVSVGESVADIGTDHGYVPLMLYRDDISPKVIMSDISNGSLDKARESFVLSGISVPEEWFRTGDGLNTIEHGEVDDVIIAGLGGKTITGILDDDISKTRSFSKLIIQPRRDSGYIRYWLYTHGYDIVSDDYAVEGRFICEIISAIRTELTCRDELYDREDPRWSYPLDLRACDNGLINQKIERRMRKVRLDLDSIARSSTDSESARNRIELERSRLQEMIRELEDVCTE